MARVQVDYNPGAEALQTTAQPNVQTEQARFDPRANRGFQLAEALGNAGPAIDKLAADQRRKKLEEQALKIDAYKEQFLQDWQGGAVSQAQVRERFPETVPIIAARIAEAIGADHGKKSIQGVIDEILNNDALRLDSAKRAEFIQQRKGELLASAGEGNDFFLNGMVKRIDAELNQYENAWQRETANYHQAVQEQAFKDQVVSTLMSGGDLLAVDGQWKGSSSLNNLERNKAVIEAVTEAAFANDNPALLDQIPQRFLNSESKLRVQQTRNQIQSARMTRFRDSIAMQNFQRDEQLRAAKIGMIEEISSGGNVDPIRYRNNPEAFDFALRIKDMGTLPTFQSVANAQAVRTQIMNGATIFSGLDQRSMTDAVMENPNINPSEKQSLIAEIPTLIEGRIAMNDPMVKSTLDLRINARLKALESSTAGMVAQITQGRNLRAEVLGTFDAGLRQEFQTFYEANQRWPTGFDKQKIIDRQTERAEKLLEELTRAGGGGAPTRGPRPVTGRPSAAEAPPQVNPETPRVTTEAEFNALPSGTTFIDPDGVTRRKP